MTDTTGTPSPSGGPVTASIPLPVAARASLGDALSVFPVALGGNVFGWTADRDASFEILDAYLAGGGNFIDTADMYPQWAPGREGGESELIIGEWLRSRGKRDDLVIATKVGVDERRPGLRPETIRAAVHESLQRLGVDRIDLYYAHRDDPDTPIDETAHAFSSLVDEGLIGAIGLSNYEASRVREWLRASDNAAWHRPVALQPHYSLVERDAERELLPVAREAGLGIVPYWGLAQGFLTGKYREGQAAGDSPRAAIASRYLDDRGSRVLRALDGISGRLKVQPGAVALAWLLTRPGVVAPIASARTPAQLPLLLEAARISLDPSEIEELERASA